MRLASFLAVAGQEVDHSHPSTYARELVIVEVTAGARRYEAGKWRDIHKHATQVRIHRMGVVDPCSIL